jgi:hypothetical protein
MHFSEDDLRSALERKDPGEGFTRRVMARIDQAGEKVSPAGRLRTWFLQLWWPLRVRTAVAAVLVAGLAFGAWLGVAHYRQLREGEMAKQQAVLALRIATAKFNHVLQRVKVSQGHEMKIRRERL